MWWVVLTISAVVIWATLNTLDKYILSKWLNNSIIPVIMQGVIGLICGLVVITFHKTPILSLTNFSLCILSGITFTLMYLFYFKSLQLEETSRVVSIFYLSPLFVAILAAIFLDEKFTNITYVGISLLIVGGFIISYKESMKVSRPFWFMLFSAIMMAVTLILTKYVLHFTDDWTVFAYSRFGSMIAVIPIIIVTLPHIRSTIKKQHKKVIGLITLDETLSLVGFFLILIAMSEGYVTLINALTSLQPFFVFLIILFVSAFYPNIMKEDLSKSTLLRKIFAISLIFIGAFIIR